MSSSGRFLHLCQQGGIREESARDIWDSLYSRYSEPHRHYHNLHHIEAMLAKMDKMSPGNVAMELAIWFHDVIYDPKARDNEEQSAAFFDTELADHLDPVLHADVVRLILATDYARQRTGAADEDLLRDIDLSILASEPEIYHAYADAVRKEYAHVPDEDFRKGRNAVLEHFLKDPIFTTVSFSSLESAARRNLESERNDLISRND